VERSFCFTTLNNNNIESKNLSWTMFNRISQRYDFLNRLLSLRRDVAWRKEILPFLPQDKEFSVLDVATGTADVLHNIINQSLNVKLAIGIDMATEMIKIGRTKIDKCNVHSVNMLMPADSRLIPFKGRTFDVVTVAFGIRNIPDINNALSELYNVLKPTGRAIILEFSIPRNRFISAIYLIYFRYILPKIGRFLSGDKIAYSYLNRTVENFPYGREFCEYLFNIGFHSVQEIPLTFGIATIYIGEKR